MSTRKSPLEMLSTRTMNLGSVKGVVVGTVFGTLAVLAVAAGCSRDNVAQAATSTTSAEVSSVQEDAAAYEIKTAVVGDCKAGQECTATITIASKGEYHVNETYPFKFTAVGAGAEFHGAAGNVFTGGDFVRQGKTGGVMTVKFKPAAKGKLSITGVYKICICTDKICQPSTTNVTIDVDVK